MEKTRILLVDDEATVLKVLQMAMQATIECDIITATSGVEALRIMEKARIDAVVCDIGMPVMDGVTFVNIVAELYPNTTRLIFTALRSTDAIGLQTAGAAHQFFLKPTSIRQLAEKIKCVQRLRSRLPPQGMDVIVAKVRSLPSLPAVYTELEQALNHPNSSMDMVGKVLEKDIAMSAKVLQLVNSAFFGAHERMTRPAQAAVHLGGEVLKSLLLGMHLFTAWKMPCIPCSSIQELWRHARAVATAARAIALAEGCTPAQADEYYAAGLFHDIGKLIIADNLAESCDHIQKIVQERGVAITQAEKEVLGATHAEAGAYLMALWGFSDNIVNTCAFHHQPSLDATPGCGPLAAVHVANVFDHALVPCGKIPMATLDQAYIAREGLAPKLEAWRRLADGTVLTRLARLSRPNT
jgi:HD-like signal output (HDOD) protein